MNLVPVCAGGDDRSECADLLHVEPDVLRHLCDNGPYLMTDTCVVAYVVSDVSTSSCQLNIVRNALPCVGARPRVPLLGRQQERRRDRRLHVVCCSAVWSDRTAPVHARQRGDARFIEAEAKLQANDIAG